MTSSVAWYRSSIGKKAIMAVSGLILFGFLIGHTLGNLQIFIGQHAINTYAAFLHNTHELLWGLRIVMVLAIIAHIVTSIQLTRDNLGARSERYAYKRKDAITTYAARTMIMSGPIIALFIIYHLLHLTTNTITVGYENQVLTGVEHGHNIDVYCNMVLSFQSIPVTIFYLIAVSLVGVHLRHGVWSFFQSLGLNHPRWNTLRDRTALAIAGFITIGLIVIPIAVLLGLGADTCS